MFARPIKIMLPELSRLLKAGEVVGKPSSAVKELCENSLDAGASRITIRISNNCTDFISVEDDGCGMGQEDLVHCMKEHSSSKTYDKTELANPKNLGFRGEALSALLSCSNVNIQSKTDGSNCYSISSFNGNIEDTVPCSGVNGTTITINNLFYNMPARLAMISKPYQEISDITSIIISLSISCPGVDFTLIHNNKNILHLPKMEFFERIKNLSNEDAIKIDYQKDGWSLKGYIYIAPKKKNGNIFIIGSRSVIRDIAFSNALKRIANTYAHKQSHSFRGVLEVPENTVLCNVHASKEEIKYLDVHFAKDFIFNGFSSCIAEARGHGYAHSWDNNKLLSIPTVNEKPLGQVIGIQGDNYIISTTDNGLVLTDAHAGHERVILEKIRLSLVKTIFLQPVMVVPILNGNYEHLEILNSIGFNIDDMGDGYWVVNKIPSILSGISESAINSILIACDQGRDVVLEKISDIACRMAFRTGQGLTIEMADSILREMEVTPGSGFCNHGRPTSVKIDLNAMARLFGR